MAVDCSATQIADFVLLWGMSGTFPEYCNYAEDARDLKSLDLITSTMGVFMEAFWLKFEGIYRKHKMHFLMSEEKFIEFLKPRCLILTKDNKCFNFMLVCAFVSEIIHSFFEYNKCFHLVKVASKCLAAILKNRFKRIFETDSGWEELMSFCIKIHSLIYPRVKKSESDGIESVGGVNEIAERGDDGKERGCRFPVTLKIDASLTNSVQGLTELSDEKYAIEENEDLDKEVSDKKTSTPLKNDLTIEKEGEKFKCSRNLEFLISTGASHTLQLKDKESSSKEESASKEKTCDEKNAREDDETVSVTDMKDSFVSFRKDLAIKKEPEKSDLCNFETTSSTETSVALKMKVEVSSLSEELEDKEKVVGEINAMDGNEEDFPTDSLLSDLVHEFDKMSTEEKAINKEVEGDEKPDKIIDFRKKLTLPSGNDSIVENVTRKLESAFSADAAHTHQLKDKESFSEDDSEDNEKPFSIHCMTADQICSRITNNPQHLSEIMNLIKKCEEDIESDLFSPDESDILINDNRDEDLKASNGTSESSRDIDLTIFELGIKTVVFATNLQNMKMSRFVKRIFSEDNSSDDESNSKSSGDESSDKMSSGEEYECVDDMLVSEDLHCPLCAGGMNKFFDACVNHFGTNWYWMHDLVTDLFSFKYH